MKLKEQPDSVKYLFEIKIDDCRKFQELVGEMDNGFLSSNDILDLEKCVELMSKIGTIKTINLFVSSYKIKYFLILNYL